jgi:large subunit ribosomal protein L5
MGATNLKKIVLNFGKKEINLKFLLSFGAGLELISYQKAAATLAGNSNISLKIKKGAPIGCKVTLRKRQLNSFFFNVICVIFTRTKQFEGFILNFKIENLKTFSFKLNDILSFAEIENQYELFKKMPTLDVTIVTDSNNASDLNVLLTSFRFPMKLPESKI